MVLNCVFLGGSLRDHAASQTDRVSSAVLLAYSSIIISPIPLGSKETFRQLGIDEIDLDLRHVSLLIEIRWSQHPDQLRRIVMSQQARENRCQRFAGLTFVVVCRRIPFCGFGELHTTSRPIGRPSVNLKQP